MRPLTAGKRREALIRRRVEFVIKFTTIVGSRDRAQTSLSFSYRLIYNYSFYRNDKVELAVSPGLYMMRTKFNFAGQGTINGVAGNTTVVNEELTLPLPSIGLVANYNSCRSYSFRVATTSSSEHNDCTGAMFEFMPALSIGSSNISPWALRTIVFRPV